MYRNNSLLLAGFQQFFNTFLLSDAETNLESSIFIHAAVRLVRVLFLNSSVYSIKDFFYFIFHHYIDRLLFFYLQLFLNNYAVSA